VKNGNVTSPKNTPCFHLSWSNSLFSMGAYKKSLPIIIHALSLTGDIMSPSHFQINPIQERL